MRKTVCWFAAAAVVCLMGGFGAFGGDAAGGGGGGGGGGGRGNFDPAAMRQRMLDGVKTALGVTDDEWKALQPKVEAVQTLARQGRMGGFRGRRGGGGDPNANATQPTSDLEKKTQELRTLLENKDSDAKAVKDKLTELRAAREKSKVDLKKAQDALRELLTPRQEAQMVLMGMLD